MSQSSDEQYTNEHIQVLGLARDLRQSYERNHEAVHYTDAEPGYITFAQCSLWVCKNRREKLAEWGIPLEGPIDTLDVTASRQ